MFTSATCIACNRAIAQNRPAMVAPFLAQSIWNRGPFPAQLARCTDCGMQFFNPRLHAEEEERLYANYRSEAYQRLRQMTEPWYTPRMNARLGDPRYIEARRDRLSGLLSRHLGQRSIATVLDFGGHTGALVQNLIPGAKAYVYDISGVAPESDVTALRSMEECRQRQFDLIISSHMLEHVSVPGAVVATMHSIAAPHSILYVEVPHESPTGPALVCRRAAQVALLLTLRPAIGLALARAGGLRWMHEHVNYFTLTALHALIDRPGWHRMNSGEYRPDANAPSGAAPVLWCLAQP